MSNLRIELFSNIKEDRRIMVLQDHGLGRVVIDQLPDMLGPYVARLDLPSDLRHRLKGVYYYLAPSTTSKSITMTWNQALQTADYLLKGTV